MIAGAAVAVRSCGRAATAALRHSFAALAAPRATTPQHCRPWVGSAVAVMPARGAKRRAEPRVASADIPPPPAGWLPDTSIKHETEVDAWTPTGTGGYPKDWAAINSESWSPDTQRCGAIGIKLGMVTTWDAWGATVPLTAIQLEDCQVVEARTDEVHGVTALVVGCKNRKPNNVRRLKPAARNQYAAQGLSRKHFYRQFKVSEAGLLPVGHSITADHFVPGQYVDVIGKTIGKGFAGVMKRHNMKGGNASHGSTKMHRKMGATGGGQDPGRIWPGKRMAGRMGNRTVITHSLQLFKIDTRWNVLYVKGAVPGAPGTPIAITDARRVNRFKETLPFPTAEPGVVPQGVHVATPSERDPGTIVRR